MNILNFIETNASSLIAVAVAIVVLALMFKNGKSEMVKEVVLSLVIKSEIKWGSGTGEIKYADVVEGIYERLPSIVIMFLSQKELDQMIEDAVTYMKHCLEGQKGIVL